MHMMEASVGGSYPSSGRPEGKGDGTWMRRRRRSARGGEPSVASPSSHPIEPGAWRAGLPAVVAALVALIIVAMTYALIR